jgi:hypothetical protein
MFGFQKGGSGGGGARCSITSGAPGAAAVTITGIVTIPGGSVSGLTVTVKKGATTLGTATTASDGTWSYSATGLSNGDVVTAQVSAPLVSAGVAASIAVPAGSYLLMTDGTALLLSDSTPLLLTA